jgi:D-alanyl-D-alanine carboxypeptidase
MILSALLLAGILLVLTWQAWRVFEEGRRERAAWKRVGTCQAVASTDRVECAGVTLVKLSLPTEIAACGVANLCEVDVNREAAPAFHAALAEVVDEDLGGFVPQFQTLNRRRCKDAITAEWIPDCVSKHSYGIAVDFRPFTDNANWAQVTDAEPGIVEVVAIFRRHGFRWGGTFSSNYDPQHLEWIPR